MNYVETPRITDQLLPASHGSRARIIYGHRENSGAETQKGFRGQIKSHSAVGMPGFWYQAVVLTSLPRHRSR